MRNIHKLGAALLAAIAAFGHADAAIGPKITLRVEEPARVGMPVWLFVDIEDACLAARYPMSTSPGIFDPLTSVEVRHNGVDARLAEQWQAWAGGSFEGPRSGPCPGTVPTDPDSRHRFPLHLLFAFDEPGEYSVRWTISDFPRPDTDYSRGEPLPPLVQSDWFTFEVAPSTPSQRELWLKAALAARPADPDAVVSDYIPSLLAAWQDARVAHALLDLACSQEPKIVRTAEASLGFPFDQAARDYALERAEHGCLASVLPALHSLQQTDPDLPRVRKMLVEAAVRHLDPGDDAATAEALGILSTMLHPPAGPDPDPALLEQTDRRVASLVPALLPRHGAASQALLLYFWRKPLTPEAHRIVWQITEQPGTARGQGLIILADLGDPADLPRLTTMLSGESADGDGYDLFSGLERVQEKFGAEAIPLLQKVMAESPYWTVRDVAAIQLARLGDRPGTEFLMQALQSKREAEPGFILSDLGGFNIPWTKNEDRAAQAITYFRDRLAQ